MKLRFAPLLALGFAAISPLHSESVMRIWAKRYDGPANLDDRAVAVAADNLGNVVVTGYSTNADNTTDYYTAKYAAADGALLWEKRYNSPANLNDRPANLTLDSSGNVVVTGYSTNASGYTDIYTAKYAAANGAILWERTDNGPFAGNANATSIAVDTPGNVLVTGYAKGSASGPTGFYTAKYAAEDGARLWFKMETDTYSHRAASVAVDMNGDAIVTGTYNWYRVANSSGILTRKYANIGGNGVWSDFVQTPYVGDEFVSESVTVDSAGNVAVTGMFRRSGTWDWIHTHKLSANGSRLWVKTEGGSAGSGDRGTSVVIDAGGNVVVAGRLRPSPNSAPNNMPVRISKYAAGNGDLLWGRSLPGEATDAAYTVRLDAAGNPVITAVSSGDYYTAKFAAADGAMLWEARYNGPANGVEGMESGDGAKLALTADGGAVVAGYSWNGTNYDFAIVRYAVAPPDADGDGLRDVWEQGWWDTTTGHSALDDFDHDGIPELMEMAFALNPKVPNSAALPPRSIEDGYLTCTISKYPGATYQVETANSPNATAFSPTTTTVLLDDGATLKVRDNFPLATNPSRYLRVKVTAAP